MFAIRSNGGWTRTVLRLTEIFRLDGLAGVTRGFGLALKNSSPARRKESQFRTLNQYPWILEAVAQVSALDAEISRVPFDHRANNPVYAHYGDNVSHAFEVTIKSLVGEKFSSFLVVDLGGDIHEGFAMLDQKEGEWLVISRSSSSEFIARSQGVRTLQTKMHRLSLDEYRTLAYHLVTTLRPSSVAVVCSEESAQFFRKFRPLIELHSQLTILEKF